MKSAMKDRKSGLRWRIRAASEMMFPEEVLLRRGHLSKDGKRVKEGMCGNLGNQAEETACAKALKQEPEFKEQPGDSQCRGSGFHPW